MALPPGSEDMHVDMHVEVRAYAELGDFLPPTDGRPGTVVRRPLRPHQTVKDLVEAAGIPHTEVDLVVVDGEPVGLDHRPRPGDRLAVYPTLRTLAPGGRLQPPPAGEVRFVADVHLGRLARLLRLLGFDTRGAGDRPGIDLPDVDDATIAAVAEEEGRIVLTRDRGLLKRSRVARGVYVRSDEPEDQAVDVVRHLGVVDRLRPMTRCLRCGGPLVPAAKADVLDQLEPLTRAHHQDFRRCTRCGRAYWPGAHRPGLESLITRVTGRLAGQAVLQRPGGLEDDDRGTSGRRACGPAP